MGKLVSYNLRSQLREFRRTGCRYVVSIHTARLPIYSMLVHKMIPKFSAHSKIITRAVLIYQQTIVLLTQYTEKGRGARSALTPQGREYYRSPWPPRGNSTRGGNRSTLPAPPDHCMCPRRTAEGSPCRWSSRSRRGRSLLPARPVRVYQNVHTHGWII